MKNNTVYRIMTVILALITIISLIITDNYRKTTLSLREREVLEAVEVIKASVDEISYELSVAYWSARTELYKSALDNILKQSGKIEGASDTAEFEKSGCVKAYARALETLCLSAPDENSPDNKQRLYELREINLEIQRLLCDRQDKISSECEDKINSFITSIEENYSASRRTSFLSSFALSTI